MTTFAVERLGRDQIHAVYPLIREAIPGLTLQAWLRFARGATGQKRGGQSGVVVARRIGRDYPSGLFCYRVERDPALDKVLVAEHFVALDLLHPAAVIDALVHELDELAARLGCTAIRSVVHGPEVEGGLISAGHAAVGSLLGKALADNGIVTVHGAGFA